jgi:hypothetical protein
MRTSLPVFVRCLGTFKLSLFFFLSVLFTHSTQGQNLCPDFGDKKIIVENDLQQSYSYPQLQVQVLGDHIYVSGGLVTYDKEYKFLSTPASQNRPLLGALKSILFKALSLARPISVRSV